MYDRIMVKVSAEDKYVSLWTVSRSNRSPHRFILLREELEKLEEEGRVLARDSHSFADIRRCKGTQGLDKLEITFWRLNDFGNGEVKGWKQVVQFSYGKFLECVECSFQSKGSEQRLLSMKEDGIPRIEFISRCNLKTVADIPLLRRKLGRFLAHNFNWIGYSRIVVTDDFLPYSFGFSGYTPYGRGVCGGIILHGQDDLKKAYYEIHT